MNRKILSLIRALAVMLIIMSGSVPAENALPLVPTGVGQLETAPALFRGGIDDDGREFFVNGQPARNGKLILTASNGFFTPGVCRTSGESSLPKSCASTECQFAG